MLIDTHSHLNFNAFKDDYEEVILRSLAEGVSMINVGSQYDTSKKAIDIASVSEDGVWASVGLHPIHAGRTRPDIDEAEKKETELENNEAGGFDYDKYKDLARSIKVVAIGETGLDYWYKPKTKRKFEEFLSKQKEIFLKQLDLANELNLPVILHCRMAHNDLFGIIEDKIKKQNHNLTGVIHCFTGSWEQAEKYLELGFYIGLNGIIFKLNLDEIISKIPLEKILVETDCPYLTPPQASGRNEPIFVKYVSEKIAELKKISFDEVSEKTTENAKKLFRL